MKILFLDTVHPILEKGLEEDGHEVVYALKQTYEEVLEILPLFQGVVIRSRIPVDERFLRTGEDLQFIARSGSGLENINLKVAEELHINVLSSPEGNMDAVGEHALGLLLMLFNKLNLGDIEVRNGIWNREKNRGLELKGKTIGIIGFGRMGSAFAQRLQGFEVNILAYDKYKRNYAPSYVQEVSLEEIQKQADIISIHLPLAEETLNYINRDFIEAVQKPFYIVNTARGKSLNIKDVLSAMDEEKILGACLDVLEFEKSDFQQDANLVNQEVFQDLVKRKNVVLSPHVAGWTVESYEKLSSVLLSKIRKSLVS